jgi:hypothetical protein
MIKSINIKNIIICVIIIISYLIKSINFKNSIIIIIKSINIKNNIICVIIIFIFIIIKSLDASKPNLECGPRRLQTHAHLPTVSGRVHVQPHVC